MSLSKTAATAAAILLIASLLLQACGRKGPLFLEKEAAKTPPASTAPIEQKTANTLVPISSQPVSTQTESQKQP